MTMRFLSLSLAKDFGSASTVPLHKLLVCLLDGRQEWSQSQVVCELQAAFPTCWDDMEIWDESSGHYICVPNPLRKHRAENPVFVDVVSEGSGVAGAKRSTNPQGFADARAALSKHQRRLVVAPVWEKRFNRVLAVCSSSARLTFALLATLRCFVAGIWCCSVFVRARRDPAGGKPCMDRPRSLSFSLIPRCEGASICGTGGDPLG